MCGLKNQTKRVVDIYGKLSSPISLQNMTSAGERHENLKIIGGSHVIKPSF